MPSSHSQPGIRSGDGEPASSTADEASKPAENDTLEAKRIVGSSQCLSNPVIGAFPCRN